MLRRTISLVLSFGLLFQQAGFAQAAGALSLAGYLNTAASSPVNQDKFRPVQMRYFSYEPASDNFKILLDKGDLDKLEDKKAKEEARTLLSYFLVGLTLPDEVFWVNLRPDAADNIIDPLLEKTDVGRIMLAADLQLKKDTAILTSPQTPEGREYWNKLYQKAEELYGHSPAQIPTITRPWIVPGEIIVRESQNSAYVYKAGLKVMLEEDYLRSPSHQVTRSPGHQPTNQPLTSNYSFSDPRLKELNEYSSRLIRETIIPRLTKEINSSKRYASLRQVYYSLVLSRWFKLRFTGKSGTYASLINTGNLANLTSREPWDKSEYFNQYQQSFAKGEYNLKEQVSTPTGQSVRSYVSGGVNWASSAINHENGVILSKDNAHKLGVVMEGRALLDPREMVLNPAKMSSPVKGEPSEILFFGGSAVAFYKKAFKDFRLFHAITPFDGGVFFEQDGTRELLSRIEDHPSSSGGLRAFAQEDLVAPGDITKVILDRAAEEAGVPGYIREILEARFTDWYVDYNSMNPDKGWVENSASRLNNFSEVIDFIAVNYRKDPKRKDNRNDLAWDREFRNFINRLKEYALKIDEDKSGPALFWGLPSDDLAEARESVTQGQRHLRHSIKNLIFYAILRKNGNEYEKSLLEFARLSGGTESALEEVMLSTYELNGVELVARVGEGEYLCGQEEITQNLGGKPIREFFFAARKDIREYINEGREGEIPEAKVLPAVNPQLLNKIKATDERNQREPRDKSFIVFGPGSQFSSVLVHLNIPGVVGALAEATHTPRVLVLNPIKEHETSGIEDKDYFNRIIAAIEDRIKAEIGEEKDISSIFDFIVINDAAQNNNDIQRQAANTARDSRRSKQRLGLIEYNIEGIKDALKGKPVTLVCGNLLEVVEGKVSYTISAMEALFKAMQKFYVQRHQRGSDSGQGGGLLLASDLHATLNAALRFKLAFPDAPLLVIGDPSDRGHNLQRLLRLTDSFVLGDHELWAVGMASGVSDYLAAMYLRMAFNYENDDLLKDLGLGRILELALEQPILSQWKQIGYLKEESDAQKAGKLFNYIFTKIYFEEMCNEFYKGNPEQREKALEKLSLVLAYAYHPGKRIFQLEERLGVALDGIFQQNNESFNPVILNRLKKELKNTKDDKKLTDAQKQRKIEDIEGRINEFSGAGERIARQIKGSLPKIDSKEHSLLTEGEKEFLKDVKKIISEKLKGPGAPDSLRNLIGHFFKGPVYRKVQIGPQVPRPEELSQVRFIDPKAEKNILLMHVLPPMVQDGSGFADMMGEKIPLGKLKDYYTKLNSALEGLRKAFLKEELSGNMRLFAGYERDAQGNITGDKEIFISEWFIRISDTIYAPLFAREHRRIESEYVDKKEEPDNIIYDLLYNPDKGKVKDEGIKTNLVRYFGLKDDGQGSDFNADDTLKGSGQEKIVQAILDGFGGANLLVVGHKKIKANQVIFLAKGKLAVLDAEFAAKGGETGALDNTQNGSALLSSDDGKNIAIKLINMQQIFNDKKEFVKSVAGDKNFAGLTEGNIPDYSLLEKAREEVIKHCSLRDIHSYKISVSIEDIRKAFGNALLDEIKKNGKGSYTIVGEIISVLKEIVGSRGENISLSTFDDLVSALASQGIQAANLNKETIEKLLDLLPGRSSWKDIVKDKPQEFLLPLIVAEEKDGSTQYKIIRADSKADSIAYTPKDADVLLDRLLAPQLKERMDNSQPTLENADFSKGSMLDEFGIASSGITNSIIRSIGLNGLESELLPGLLDGYDLNAIELDDLPSNIDNTIQKGEAYHEADGYRVSLRKKAAVNPAENDETALFEVNMPDNEVLEIKAFRNEPFKDVFGNTDDEVYREQLKFVTVLNALTYDDSQTVKFQKISGMSAEDFNKIRAIRRVYKDEGCDGKKIGNNKIVVNKERKPGAPDFNFFLEQFKITFGLGEENAKKRIRELKTAIDRFIYQNDFLAQLAALQVESGKWSYDLAAKILFLEQLNVGFVDVNIIKRLKEANRAPREAIAGDYKYEFQYNPDRQYRSSTGEKKTEETFVSHTYMNRALPLQRWIEVGTGEDKFIITANPYPHLRNSLNLIHYEFKHQVVDAEGVKAIYGFLEKAKPPKGQPRFRMFINAHYAGLSFDHLHFQGFYKKANIEKVLGKENRGQGLEEIGKTNGVDYYKLKGHPMESILLLESAKSDTISEAISKVCALALNREAGDKDSLTEKSHFTYGIFLVCEEDENGVMVYRAFLFVKSLNPSGFDNDKKNRIERNVIVYTDDQSKQAEANGLRKDIEQAAVLNDQKKYNDLCKNGIDEGLILFVGRPATVEMVDTLLYDSYAKETIYNLATSDDKRKEYVLRRIFEAVEYGDFESRIVTQIKGWASAPLMQPIPDKKAGGIDWRGLPMSIQPMGSFRGLNFGLPILSQAEIEQLKIDSQIGQIKEMVRSGISPSGRRVKELVAACAQKGGISAYADTLLLCMADILKLEEENARESSPELMEALVIVDSQG